MKILWSLDLGNSKSCMTDWLKVNKLLAIIYEAVLISFLENSDK